MAAIPLENEIYYPESDGEPMAESEERIRALEEELARLRRQAD